MVQNRTTPEGAGGQATPKGVGGENRWGRGRPSSPMVRPGGGGGGGGCGPARRGGSSGAQGWRAGGQRAFNGGRSSRPVVCGRGAPRGWCGAAGFERRGAQDTQCMGRRAGEGRQAATSARSRPIGAGRAGGCGVGRAAGMAWATCGRGPGCAGRWR
uniref:Uncharacterized protein n=1 Tax=Setaria viridis TaxID=4556 RepID=A0A4V6DB05_SETVI|nr:hypothetical protein SEVIR_2G137500v2 [Setaria viridis]